MKRLLGCMAACILVAPSVLAQTAEVKATPLTDTDVQLLRSDLQADKNRVIADTMKFTDAESSAFWPLYRDYAHGQQLIGDDRLSLLTDYARHIDAMSDDQANELMHRMLNIEAKVVNLREEYWPKFEKALGAKRAAKFYQVDHRLSMMINIQLASQVPLIP